MTDSFAGISVPEGSVGELRGASSRLSHQASVLSEAATGLRAMPASAGSWIGPAHGAYANRCLTASAAAGLAARAFITAAGAAAAYADELHAAQAKAKAAIADARAARKTIDHAHDEIDSARGREHTAQGRIDTAIHMQSLAAVSGGDGGAADAMLNAAVADLHRAEHDERHWLGVLHRAQHDLADAKRRGTAAEREARDAARSANTLFAAAGASMPILPPPPPPAQPHDDRPGIVKALDWGWNQVKAAPGAAKDATVGLATGLAHDVHDAVEQDYNRLFHPGLAFQHDLEQQRAMGQAFSDPIGTVKAIFNWDDLSHGRVGAWIGGFAPDAVLAALTAGGGAAARFARAERVSELGSRSLERSAGAYDNAVRVHGRLRPPSDFADKTVAATRRANTLSGWTHGNALKDIEHVPPEDVHRMADQMGFDVRGAGASDFAGNEPGFRGKYHSSHAEAQQLERYPAQPIGVDQPMCKTCQKMFDHAANHMQEPLVVRDPDHTRLFLPGHKVVVDPDPSDFPNVPFLRPDDVHRGLAAGAGAAVAHPAR